MPLIPLLSPPGSRRRAAFDPLTLAPFLILDAVPDAAHFAANDDGSGGVPTFPGVWGRWFDLSANEIDPSQGSPAAQFTLAAQGVRRTDSSSVAPLAASVSLGGEWTLYIVGDAAAATGAWFTGDTALIAHNATNIVITDDAENTATIPFGAMAGVLRLSRDGSGILSMAATGYPAGGEGVEVGEITLTTLATFAANDYLRYAIAYGGPPSAALESYIAGRWPGATLP